MAVNPAFNGAGTTLSSGYYIRNFYSAARNARTTAGRRDMSNPELTQADGAALRRAVRSLSRSEFTETQDEDIRNKAMAYVETYNHMLASASESSDDRILRSAKQMKALTQSYASELDKIGITVNDDGTLESREARLSTSPLSKLEKLFSKDSGFMQKISAHSRKIERQSDALLTEEAQRRAAKRTAAQGTVTDPGSAGSTSSGAAGSFAAGSPATAAAQIVSAAMDLDMLSHTGIGGHINLTL